jgi:uncharacterized protein YndB with AHSA1/START domain
MSAITASVEISRRPEEVFAYMTDESRLPEWQESLVSCRTEDNAPLHAGSKMAMTRRMGKREFTMNSQFDEVTAPRTIRSHGIDGPIRPKVQTTIEPIDNGQRSRVNFSLDFETHGMGRVLVPLVVRPNARKEVPRDYQHLKEILERGM